MELTVNALKVLEARYLLKNEKGKLSETPEEMWWRIATTLASSEKEEAREKWAAEFHRVMSELLFLPNSPTLMNAGHPDGGVLSACFVIPIDDVMDSDYGEEHKKLFGIMNAIKAAGRVQKYGGGTGFSLSRLRPGASMVGRTRKAACGPIGVLKMLDATAEFIKQGGRRHGANMAVLKVDHPDIMDFINCKLEEGKFANFNISVGVTENFIRAIHADEKYDLIDPKSNKRSGTLRAKEVFDTIVKNMYTNGEPGILFLDTINNGHPVPELGKIESTNPCGEQPLLPFESCNLGSINLAAHVLEGRLDFDLFSETIRTAVRLLDDVIEIADFAVEEIAKVSKITRKIGLGIMGWADTLIALGIPYNSNKALRLAKKVAAHLYTIAKKESESLAAEKGPFPGWKGPTPTIETARRNACLITVAPTGSLSKIANCSPSIEPLFGIAYETHVLDGESLKYTVESFSKRVEVTEALLDEILKNHGSVQNITSIPSDIRSLFVTSLDIKPYYHVKMQAAFQEHTDSGVSKTVNLPEEASMGEIAQIILMAHDEGCKGITVYRNNSRKKQVITHGGQVVSPQGFILPRKRTDELVGKTRGFVTGECGKLYVTVNKNEETGVIEEMFGQATSARAGCPPLIGIVNRLMSYLLRLGVSPEWLAQKLEVKPCHACMVPGATATSCPDAFKQALEKASGHCSPRMLGKPTPLSSPIPCLMDGCNGILIKREDHKQSCRVCTVCGEIFCGMA